MPEYFISQVHWVGLSASYISQVHWVVFRTENSSARLEIWDMRPHAFLSTLKEARTFLQFLSAVTKDTKYSSFEIVIMDSSHYLSLPVQDDDSSCGIFACVFVYHLLMDSKMHFTQEDIPRWRKFVTAKILLLEGN